jgi:hypothetical protein
MKARLEKPFRKALKQARRVADSNNNKREVHKLCAMLKEAIRG